MLAEYFSRFRSAFAFVDAWRKLHRRARSFTWFNSDHSIASRLDKFFVSKNIGDKQISASVVPFPLSDHDLINLHIDLGNYVSSGPGFWKFNSSLLANSDFSQSISDFISNFVSTIDSFTNVLDWWYLFKNSLKAEIIEFSKRARTKSSHSRVLLANRLIALKRRLALRDRSVSLEISQVEQDLNLSFWPI